MCRKALANKRAFPGAPIEGGSVSELSARSKCFGGEFLGGKEAFSSEGGIASFGETFYLSKMRDGEAKGAVGEPGSTWVFSSERENAP